MFSFSLSVVQALLGPGLGSLSGCRRSGSGLLKKKHAGLSTGRSGGGGGGKPFELKRELATKDEVLEETGVRNVGI